MATLRSDINLSLRATRSSDVDLGSAAYNLSYSKSIRLLTGALANQASEVMALTGTVDAEDDVEIDLNAALQNVFGESLTLTKVKTLIIHSPAENTVDLIVGGADSNAFASMFGAATDTLILKPGGTIALIAPDADGYAVAAGTGDILKIENTDEEDSASYELVILGS
jgi:hypothetical protein